MGAGVPRSSGSYWLAGFFWALIPVSAGYLLALASPVLRADLQRGPESPLTWIFLGVFIVLTWVEAVVLATRDLRRAERGR